MKLMEAKANDSFFFSDNFLMQVKFNLNATMEGWVVHYPIGLNLAKRFQGISVEENGSIKCSFFIRWSDANLNSDVLTAYAGEICQLHTGERRLVLEWLQVPTNPTGVSWTNCKGSETLWDVTANGILNESRRAAFFEMFGQSLKRF